MSQVEVDKIIPQSGTTLTVGDSGDTITITSGASISGFKSTGITDNSTTNAITIGSDETVTIIKNLVVDTNTLYVDSVNNRVGIGTTAPESILHVVGTSDLQSPIKIQALNANGTTLISDRYLANESFSNIGLAYSGAALVLGSFVKPSNVSESDATGYLSSFDGSAVKRSAIKIDGINGEIKFLTTNTLATVSIDTAVAMTERVRIHSNGVTAFNDGIALGVGTANTSSNVLDDYEEGTWTPTITSGFNAGVTYAIQGGTYTKIGNRVFFTCRLEIGTGTGNGNIVTIGGLPFTSASSPSGSFAGAGVFSYVNVNIINSTSTNAPTIYVSQNATGMNLYQTNGNTFNGTDLSVPTNADFYLTGSYLTN